MNKLLIGENIIKSFGENTVIDKISVEISEGEFVSVMGPSGSGKSTLMFALSGTDNIDSGKITFDGMDFLSLKEDELSDVRRMKMGFVFQQPTLLKNLNILDNIILPSMRDNRKNVNKIIEKARKLMKMTGILDIADRDITEASGGQLQRAGICRALINSPKIIFGDEPTGALNSKSAQDIMDLLSQINEDGTTIMLITHDPKIAAQTERILFMSDGKIVNEMRIPRTINMDIDYRIKKVTEEMQKVGI